MHIPHTGGRALNHWLRREKIPNTRVHNADQMKSLCDNAAANAQYPIFYFILRHPVERGYREWMHYSRNLDALGRVNHLDRSSLAEQGCDYHKPEDYFQLEVNRNVYCKFLLHRTDFEQPITRSDFEQIKELENVKFDWFSSLPNLPVLDEILNHTHPVDLDTIKTNDKRLESIDIPGAVKDVIEKWNEWDMRLFAKTALSLLDVD